MSTVLLTDDRQQTTTIHPPDIEDRKILSIPDRAGQQRLPLADRLSIRIGLWLLHRSLERESSPVADLPDIQRRAIGEREAMAVLAYGLQRRLL